jgi:hypothetical protein
MTTKILSFPRRFAATSPRVSPRISLSAEEAAFSHPRFGLHLADPPADLIPQANPSLDLTSQVAVAVDQMDREIVHRIMEDRLHRLSTQTALPAVLPA